MEETIKEYAKIDGAFIIRRDGTLEAAGAYLSGRPAAEEMHSGLGARHAVAQGITALSAAMAVVLSESTRKVTVFRGGQEGDGALGVKILAPTGFSLYDVDTCFTAFVRAPIP